MDAATRYVYLRDTFNASWTTTHTAITLVALTTLACVIREIYIWRFHLRGIPSPFWNTFTCNWTLFRKGISGILYEWEKQQNLEKGRLVRIGPNHVTTDDPETLKRIGHIKSEYTKAEWFTFSTRFLAGADGTISLGRRGQKNLHVERRALLLPTYYGKENSSPSMEEAMNRQIADFVQLIDTRYAYTPGGRCTPCPFGDLGQYFTLDLSAVLLWSEPYGFLKQESDVGNYFQTLESFSPIRAGLGSVSFWCMIYPALERFFAPTPKDKAGVGRLEGIAKEKADARVRQIEAGEKDVKKDMLTAFISKGFRGNELYGELFMAIVASSDPPGSMLRIIFGLLVVTPMAYQRLNKEIASAIASGVISAPIQANEARALPYLQAVIRETVRLYPTPAEMYREVPEGGDVVAGHRLPAGTWIGQNLTAMMRRKDIWGDDADLFRPERWMEAAEEGEERFRYLCGVADLSFGSGRYTCVGKAMGQILLGKTVVELLRHFDFAAVRPERPITISVYNLYLVKDQAFLVTRKEC